MADATEAPDCPSTVMSTSDRLINIAQRLDERLFKDQTRSRNAGTRPAPAGSSPSWHPSDDDPHRFYGRLDGLY